MITYTIVIEEKDGKMHINTSGNMDTTTELEKSFAMNLLSLVREDIILFNKTVRLVMEEETQAKARLN